MRGAAAVVMAALAVTSTAAAQPSLTPPGPPEPSPSSPSGTRKDPGTALLWSLGVTLGGAALLGVAQAAEDNGSSDAVVNSFGAVGSIAFLVGPTTGHWYSGRYAHTATGVRLGGAVGATAGLFMTLECAFGENDDCDVGVALFVVGSIAHTVGLVWEIGAAPSSARRYNREHGWDVQIAPAPMAGGAGVVVGGAF